MTVLQHLFFNAIPHPVSLKGVYTRSDQCVLDPFRESKGEHSKYKITTPLDTLILTLCT